MTPIERFSLRKNWELVNFCEFDKYATKSYCAIHGVDESLNLGDITKVDETKLEDFKKSINLTTFADCQSSDTDLVWGVEYGHYGPNWIHSYDTIFPLREIEFEGLEFPCMNKPEEYLQELYGDYMSYPKRIGMGHTMYKEFSQEEMEVIEGLITHDSN